MPRVPQYSRDCSGNYIIANDNSVDLKLQLLEKKLSEKLEQKQNTLIAGENITIKDDVISATCRGGEPAEYIKSAEVSEDGNTLTLTNKDDTTVEFSPKHGDDEFDEYFQIGMDIGNLEQGSGVFPGTTVKELLLHMLERQEPVGTMFAFFYDGDTPLEEGE